MNSTICPCLPPQAEERLVELHNGCICCTLRADLLAEVAALAAVGRFDYLIIESTGVSEPMQASMSGTSQSERAGPGKQAQNASSMQGRLH